MTKQDEILKKFHELGHTEAGLRTWIMGDTVLVPLGKKDTDGQIEFFPSLVYLILEDAGTWTVMFECVNVYECSDEVAIWLVDWCNQYYLTREDKHMTRSN